MDATSYVCVTDFEERAQQLLDPKVLDYYRSGAGEQFTLNLNREAFSRLRIRPRCLRNVSNLKTNLNILGCKADWPVGISPSAMQKLAHSEGEGGNARAAGEMGSIFILSTLATMSIEEVAEEAPDTIKWLQLYVYKNRALTEQLVLRAEKAGYKAIVLTVDSPTFGERWADLRNNFMLPSHLRMANFSQPASNSQQNIVDTNAYASTQFDDSLTWKDVEWLVQRTHLPVIAKGILTAEDAILAREAGCAGVIVSNHGARQLDYVPASIEALPEIVQAVGNDIDVMVDGGIRHGTDVFKALALGAKMVFVGRPALWALACKGSVGVKEMLQLLNNDFKKTLALAGCQHLGEIRRNMVAHESEYAKL